jgi:hypothetical protein
MSKYHAQPVVEDGIRFDSKAEWRRYGELKLLAQAGDIHGLECHPRFPLVVNGHKVGYYEADFRYHERGRGVIVEDVKGVVTPIFRLKKKLVAALYGFEIVEVKV